MENFDEKTAAYFDEHTPEYSLNRLEYAAQFIKTHAHADSSLIDIGCGNGNTLKYIKDNTPIEQLYGGDISDNYLKKTQENVGCKTLRGSILDNEFVETIAEKFDFSILAAVLHHLVGKTRRQSRENASVAVTNALRLIKPGGHLIILEPVFYPTFIMSVVFYTKRIATKVTSERIQIFGKWNNIGAPVVSYFTNEQLESLIAETPDCSLVDRELKEKRPNTLMRLAGITRRTDSTFIVQLDSEKGEIGSL
jgi:SAM-dependent methyltransferase